jgi:hypothetical protein
VVKGGSNEGHKKRVGVHRSRLELRMELTSQEPGMVTDFHNFHQLSIWRDAAHDQPCLLQPLSKVIIKFIPVTMPF